MCLKPTNIESIPKETVRIAKAAFPKGNLYLKMRDELGTVFSDLDFMVLYPSKGQPAFSPWRLALITVVNFLKIYQIDNLLIQFVQELTGNTLLV